MARSCVVERTVASQLELLRDAQLYFFEDFWEKDGEVSAELFVQMNQRILCLCLWERK